MGPEELLGESEYSTAEGGERVVATPGRAPGGPPDRDPFTYDADADLGRRALEDATEAPAQERYEPSAEPDVAVEEAEVEFSGEEVEWTVEEIGPVVTGNEPDEAVLKREAEELAREEAERAGDPTSPARRRP